jgi:hypothetical protein
MREVYLLIPAARPFMMVETAFSLAPPMKNGSLNACGAYLLQWTEDTPVDVCRHRITGKICETFV